MSVSPEILEIEKKLVLLEATTEYTRQDMSRLENRMMKLEEKQDDLDERITVIQSKLDTVEDSLKELKDNPFLAFTSKLDIKKTVMIIIIIASIISSLSTLDFLATTNNSDTQREILEKLEKIINE